MLWRVHAFRVRHTPTQARSQIEAIGSRDRRLRLSRAATGYSIQEFSRGVKVASVAGGLLDHVQDHPAKIGDGLVCRVEVKFAEQSRVQVPRSQDLVRAHTLTAVLHEHRIEPSTPRSGHPRPRQPDRPPTHRPDQSKAVSTWVIAVGQPGLLTRRQAGRRLDCRLS
jgi:hypothetical protein